jgi:hypothetical protein
MSSETLVPEMEGAVGEGIIGVDAVEEGTVPPIQTPDFNHCYNFVESVNPMFDPRSVLLRRTFFINEDCSKYYLLGTTSPRLSTLGGSRRLDHNACSSHGRTRADIRVPSAENMLGHVW